MEEKERYIIDRFDEDIFDTKKEYYPSNQTICEIINQQDKRIKELCKQVIELNKENNILRKFKDDILIVQENPFQFWKENQQLRQSQKQLAIKELEELQKEFDYCPYSGDSICVAEVYDKIFAKIKELKGE